MGKLQTIRKIDKALDSKFKTGIEAFIVGGVTGVFASAIISGSSMYANDKQFLIDSNFAITLLRIIAVMVLSIILYTKKDSFSRIAMFLCVYVYTIKVAYDARNVTWSNGDLNNTEKAFFLCVLSFVAVFTFIYVKDDVLKIFSFLKVNNLTRNIIVAGIGFLLFAFIGYIGYMRQKIYATPTFDFGIFAQMYEYMVQKGTMETTVERSMVLSHFGVHFSPIFYLGLPLYFLFPSPITVHLIQAIVLALPVIPIVLLSKRYGLSNWMTIGLTLFYALYPTVSYGAINYDIHENCFLVFTILMLLYYCEKCSYVGIVICTLLTCIVKEDAAIYVLVIGAYFILSRRGKIKGLFLLIFGIGFFVLAVSIVNSYGLGIIDDKFNDYMFTDKRSLFEVIQTIITNPSYFFGQLIKNYTADQPTPEKLEYLLLMIVPMAPLLFNVKGKYSRFILLTPFVLINLGTTYICMHQITFHYAYGSVALMIYLAIMNLSEIDTKKAATRLIPSILCVSILFVGLLLGNIKYYNDIYDTNKDIFNQLDEALATIPSDASVSTTGFFTTHLTKNLVLYEQSLYQQEHNGESPDVDYLVVDLRGDDMQYFNDSINTGNYLLTYQVDNVIAIYKKN